MTAEQSGHAHAKQCSLLIIDDRKSHVPLCAILQPRAINAVQSRLKRVNDFPIRIVQSGATR